MILVLKSTENKISLDDIKKIINAKDRTLTPQTAPPQGLTLIDIKY